MIGFATPGYLLAGAILALVPLALHMLARTAPDRRPLPTARFLTVDRRTRLRLRRPADLALLALRMIFLVILGAAFAGPEWLPERAGGSVVVLLDTGAEMAPVWESAVAVARDRLGEDGTLVVFDTVARIAADPDGALDSLQAAGAGAGPASYLAALRGLKAAAAGLPAESAAAVLVTRPRWDAWSPGVTTARAAAWPARIEVVAVDLPRRDLDEAEDPRTDESVEAAGGPGAAASRSGARGVERGRQVGVVVGPEAHPLRPYATAALRALGYELASDTTADLVIVLPAVDGERPGTAAVDGEEGPVAGSAPGGALPGNVADAPRVLRMGGPAGGRAGAAPWSDSDRESTGPPRAAGRLVLPGGHALAGWIPRGGSIADGAVVVAVWEDGRPAAAATDQAERCVAYLAAEPETPGAAADPAFPWLLRALANGCGQGHAGGLAVRDAGYVAVSDAPDGALPGVPLDRGARTVLRGDTLPATADLLSVGAAHGRSLTRLLLALVLVVAMAEAAIAYGRRGVA